MMLHERIALITGASRGIGRAIALRFAREGCAIAFTDLNKDDAALSLIADIESMGIEVVFYQADASSFERAEQVVSQVIADFGRIDILVCNAGITRDTLLLRMTPSQWDQVIEVNLKSVFNYCHAVSPVFVSQRHGAIIAMSSVVGIGGNAGQTNYAASKAGIIGFIKSLSKELGSRNIRANAIAPGFVDTDMTHCLPDDIRDQFLSRIPMHRAAEMDEVASVALFLASDMSSYITGQVISVDGGMS